MQDLPMVTAIVVVRDEENMVGKCLESLIVQDYPKELYEILVIDGMSEDNTLGVVKAYMNVPVSVRVLTNRDRILSTGWNMGIREAKGKYVVRLDAHSTAESDFLRMNVEALDRLPDVGCVGGSMETRSTTWLGKSISKVLSSPFGVGNSKFRVSKKAQYVDTVAFGMYRKEIFMDLGGFDESMKRNQDLEMHSRMRKAGWMLYLDPVIKTTYFARSNLRGFADQAWQNGWWNIVTLFRDKNALSVRHLVPLFFVIFNLLGILAAMVFPVCKCVYLTTMGLYCGLATVFSIKSVARSGEWHAVFAMPFLFMVLHVCYGSGSLSSLINHVMTRESDMGC